MPTGVFTSSDLIDRVLAIHQEHPDYTNQKIADMCNTSHSTVGRIRLGRIKKRQITYTKDEDGILNFDRPKEAIDNRDDLPKENIRHQLDKLDKKLHIIMSELGIEDMEDRPRE